jgi:hypothetical protein
MHGVKHGLHAGAWPCTFLAACATNTLLNSLLGVVHVVHTLRMYIR